MAIIIRTCGKIEEIENPTIEDIKTAVCGNNVFCENLVCGLYMYANIHYYSRLDNNGKSFLLQ